MKNARDLLDAIANAGAALNLAVSQMEDGAPLGDLTDPIKVLSRAVARAEVLLAVESTTPVDQRLEERRFTDEDRADRAMTIDLLETAASMPSSPVSVRLTARRLDDESIEDAMRQFVDKQSFIARPSGFGFEMDVTRLLASIAERYLPPEE